MVFLSLLLTHTLYGETVSKHPTTEVLTSNTLLNTDKEQNDMRLIDEMIRKKQALLKKIEKSATAQYVSLYDEIAQLMISKNNILLDLERTDDIDTDKTCDIALKYEEVEFIKTQYYKTPFHDEVAKTLQNITSLYEQCHPPMAKKYLQSILQIKENIYGKESVEAANAYDALGDHDRVYMANFKQAIAAYETAKSIREKLYSDNDPRITKNYGKLAFSLYYSGDKNKQAEKLLLRSIALRKKSYPNKELSLGEAYMDAGIYFDLQGDNAKYLKYSKKAKSVLKGEEKKCSKN